MKLDHWVTLTVDDVCQRVSVGIVIKPSQYYVFDGSGILAFRSANVGLGKIIDRDWVYISAEGHSANAKSELQTGDVLVVRTGAPGTACVLTEEYSGSNCIDIVFARPDQSQVIPEYLAALTNSVVGQRHVGGNTSGLAQKHFNVGAYKELVLDLPPLPEQYRIVDILRTWDEAIEHLEALRAAKEARLNVLREKLTFADADGEPTRLGDVSEEITTRNGDGALGREMVMGVTNSRGIVPMREQTIAEDISRYKLVPHLGFAYNPMRINVGSIAMNESTETILVSPDYVVFSCLEGGLSPDFLDHLRKTKWWAHYINSGGSGSVRQRTYYADLAAMKVPLPTNKEQVKIAGILNIAKQDVDLTAREILALQRQKRGLMQKLLTGEWRVKVDTVAETVE